MIVALRLAALILALSVCAPAPASGYPGEWPATSDRAELMRAAAIDFWASRWDGPLPCNGGADIITTYARDLTDGDGAANGRAYACSPDGPAHVWVSDHYQRDAAAKQVAFGRGLYPTIRFYTAIGECLVWLHEFGHAFGLSHSPTGIMSISDPSPPQVPPECIRVAHLLDPRPSTSRTTKLHR